jgi:diacylglycerol kinase family enzyme
VLLLAGRALLGRLHAADDLEARLVGELEVRVDRASLPVAVDGEVLRLDAPLRYRSRPRALLVLAPPDADGSAE